MKAATKTPAAERDERRFHIAGALTSVRLEGLEPTPAALAIFDRYVAGEISMEQMGAEVRASNAREFGSIPVSGD